jgi:acyl phosphate:glycerol-3-phosphate acyltransferase
VIEAILKIVLAWLLGSVVGSLVLGRLRGTPDIRTQGSGNAGGTNAWRTQGAAFALAVLCIDMGKGWLAVRGLAAKSATPWLPLGCAAAVVLGHVYPAWFGLRGGKGMATFVGTLAALAPALLIPLAVAWVLVLGVSGFVGLASMVSVAAAASWQELAGMPSPLNAFLVIASLFMIWTHRQNIARLRAGTETRLRLPWRAK